MSSEDMECKDNRKLLTMQPYGTINVFLNKAQTFRTQEYLCINFPQESGENTKYKLEIKDEEFCNLNFGEQYSYLVDENSKTMSFKFGFNVS